MKTDFQEKQKKFRQYRQKYDQQQLRTIKLIAETVKTIVKNDNKNLSNNDIKELCLKVYHKYDKIKHVRVRNTLNTEITQNKINEALISFYSSAGLNKEEAINLLNLAKETAKEKKDVTNLLKIVEKYENAANLTQKTATRATYSETTDFSKIGKDGQPAQKIVKTLELTNEQAIASDIRPDLNSKQGNDSDVIDSTKEQNNV